MVTTAVSTIAVAVVAMSAIDVTTIAEITIAEITITETTTVVTFKHDRKRYDLLGAKISLNHIAGLIALATPLRFSDPSITEF